MRNFIFHFSILLILCSSIICSYELTSTYDVSNFFDNFYFDAVPDPTHGVVEYVDRPTATSLGLAKYTNNKVYVGVDYASVLEAGGRKSLRLLSKRVLNGNNLIIIDLDHMPSTVGNILPQGCSLWPAFWTVGPDWPNNGEIDMIEYKNTDSTISAVLHTNAGCDQTNVSPNVFSGTSGSTNCDNNAPGQYTGAGCLISGNPNTVGAAFNSQTNNGNGKGGVFALEWDITGNKIQSFYFPRGSVPQDILNKKPAPSTWGTPYARFVVGPANCPSNKFIDQNIILDTTFCGDWAGDWNLFGGACSTTISCRDFVYNHPAEFSEAYWLINYLDIYDAVTVPVTRPVAAPVTTPVAAPVTTPVAAPVTAPVAAPVTAPVAAPVTTPVAAPVTAPVAVPATAPVAVPVTAPVAVPVTSNVTSTVPMNTTTNTTNDAPPATTSSSSSAASLSKGVIAAIVVPIVFVFLLIFLGIFVFRAELLGMSKGTNPEVPNNSNC